MNIVFIALEVAPTKDGAFTGGLVNNVIRLSGSLTRGGHKVKIITTDVNRSLTNGIHEYSWGTIEAVDVGGKFSSLRSNLEFLLKIGPKLRKEDKINKIDVIHVHSAYSIFGLVSYLISFFLNKPIIFTLYSPVRRMPLNDRKGFYQLFSSGIFTKIILKRAGKLSCLNENIKKTINEIGINRDISIIPPIVDTEVFNPRLDSSKKRKELGIPQSAPLILYCGSWTKWKGVHILIQSISELKEDIRDINLIAAWGEPYDWYDESKIELDKLICLSGLDKTIVELGIVKNIQELFSACDIFVAPFINIDGVADPPLSILEAMACGKIVVATKVGSLPQIIKNGDNGFLIDPNNSGELINILRKIIPHLNNGNQIGENAAKYVTDHYSAESVASIAVNVYRNIDGKNK